MKPVVFSTLARHEVDAAARWFEDRREGLGAEFYQRVQEAAEKIELNPQGFQLVYKDLRRVGLNQFKEWALWFRVMPDQSVVIACLSGKRHPGLSKEGAAGLIEMPNPE